MPASSWFLVGESRPLLMALGHVLLDLCPCRFRVWVVVVRSRRGERKRKGKEEERQDTATEDQCEAGRSHREARARRDRNPRARTVQALFGPPSTPVLALRAFPNKPINITRRARGRDRQWKQAKLRSRQGAVTENTIPAWGGQVGPRPVDGLRWEGGAEEDEEDTHSHTHPHTHAHRVPSPCAHTCRHTHTRTDRLYTNWVSLVWAVSAGT